MRYFFSKTLRKTGLHGSSWIFMLMALGAYLGAQGQVSLTAGMVIDHSITVKPGTYRLPSASLETPAIAVRGANVTIDLTGVTIEGGEPLADPDGYTGVGILIDGASNVTIKGGAVRGYKIGIRAAKSPKLHITGVDASYNYKQRLWSGIEKESLLDWMSYHQNEKDEWLRYGAAIYVTDCDECVFDNNVALQGENGLMLTRVNHSQVWNNNFSWNSALGLALYRSSDNQVGGNRLDWDVRGYSNGFYFRGQDSSAILIYEQSSRNVFSYNSATHGGDGVFLWAGQTTMDTGQGGANDNLFVKNDFSHAVANGIEATFSRNKFIQNRVDDCWHGVWGGYSYDSVFMDNSFVGNTDGIAIEHGQNNLIAGNTFKNNDTAIRLWANATQDPSWGYAKARDTRSLGYKIYGNTFDGNKLEVSTLRTDAVEVRHDLLPPVGYYPVELTTAQDALLGKDARQGRSTIIVDEWGPYDYKSPKLWPVGKPSDRPLKLRVLGPEGKWTLKSIRGGVTDSKAGVITPWPQPATEISVTPTGAGTDLEVTLEYVGGEVVSPRGQRTSAGMPYIFTYRQFEPAANWTLKAWTFDEASDPIDKPDAFLARLKSAPAKTLKPARIDFQSGGVFIDGLPRDRVALEAEGNVSLSGAVTMDVISDDGIRVWIDGKLAIDRWSVHESELDHAPLAAGRHHIKIEYFEQTGWEELQVRFRRN
jgi:parallel beta-helix repeat protein